MAKNGLSFFQNIALKLEKVPYSKKTSLKILDEVKRRTLTDAVKLYAECGGDDEPLELTDSKLGGFPYWVKGKEYPKAKDDGTPLVLLAQINFEQLPFLPDFPTKGILQFFAKADSHYGCEFFKLNDERWRCVFHEEIGEPMSVEELKAIGVKSAADLDSEKEEYFPIHTEFLLSGEKTQVSMSSACEGRFESVVRDVAKDFGLKEADEALVACNILDEDAMESYWDDCEQGSKIGGYPSFTQEDPRKADDGYDVLLLQIDSESASSEDASPRDDIMWGDMGIANFFIKKEDLINRDFSKVLYNWDCY